MLAPFLFGVLRKSEAVGSLVEMQTWRKQLRYATKAKRYDLALRAIDNIFALESKALRALIKRKPLGMPKQMR